MKRHPWKQDALLIAVLALFSAGTWLLPEPEKPAVQSGTPVRGTVQTVDNRNLEVHGLLEFGSQHLTVRLSESSLKGQTFAAENELRAQMELDKKFQPGDKVLAVLPPGKTGPDTVLHARDYDRTTGLWVLAGIFCLGLAGFGGWVGIKALLSFLLSCLVIWKIVIPLTLLGWSASWTISGCVIILTAVIQYLVAGLNRKGTAAFCGASAGILAGILMAKLFTVLLKINGAILPYSQVLYFSGYEKLDLQDLFAGAVILACSGAVMDLAMDIASGVEEVARHAPCVAAPGLTLSGIRIGRSVVGTMTTTLLLAYSGGYITLLMMFYAQGNHLAEIVNNPLVASEVVKTLIGSFSLLLVAPFTALFAGWIFRPVKNAHR